MACEAAISGILSNLSLDHPTAIPVVLTGPDELETWMLAPWDEAKGATRAAARRCTPDLAQGERTDLPRGATGRPHLRSRGDLLAGVLNGRGRETGHRDG